MDHAAHRLVRPRWFRPEGVYFFSAQFLWCLVTGRTAALVAMQTAPPPPGIIPGGSRHATLTIRDAGVA